MDMTQEELQKLLDEFGQSEIANTPQWKIDQAEMLRDLSPYAIQIAKEKNAWKNNGKTNKLSGHMSSLGKNWGKINGNHPNSVESARKMGKLYGKSNMEKYMTKEDKIRGAKKAGKKHLESGHWHNVIQIGAKVSAEKRVEQKLEKFKIILNSISSTTFITKDAKEACELHQYHSWKKFLRENPYIIQIHKGTNQTNPSIYKKI